ncbi:membrane protein [Beggiatoa sp. PS]|nr:membrane protein [Beggiatoa sp. PS]
MLIIVTNIEVCLSLLLAGYLGWAGKHHQLAQQLGFILIIIGFMILSFGHIFSVIHTTFSITSNLPFINDVGINIIFVVGYILLFVGFLKWIPFVIGLRQQQLVSPQLNQKSQNAQVVLPNKTVFQLSQHEEFWGPSLIQWQRTYDNLMFFLDFMSLAFIEWDAKGRVISWSPQAERLFWLDSHRSNG